MRLGVNLSLRVGPLSWSPRRGRVSLALPGPFTLTHQTRPQRRRRPHTYRPAPAREVRTFRPAVAPLPSVTECRCGHTATAHEHYRRGDNCAFCDCNRYRRTTTPRSTR